MLAGVARIIEICFLMPKYTSEQTSSSDNNSEHTLTEGQNGGNSTNWHVVKNFRHLPPFVSRLPCFLCHTLGANRVSV